MERKVLREVEQQMLPAQMKIPAQVILAPGQIS